MMSGADDISRRLLPAVEELLSFPVGSTVTNQFYEEDNTNDHGSSGPDANDVHGGATMTTAEYNKMADAAERLITEMTYVLSVGLFERHELWTVLETLSLVPEKVATETSLRRTSTHGGPHASLSVPVDEVVSSSTAGAAMAASSRCESSETEGQRSAAESSSPSASRPANSFARRVHFASQLVYVIQHTFKDYPAPVRTRAFLRLALNQGCLLAALELIARYNRAEIAVYYREPWRGVLLQYDTVAARPPHVPCTRPDGRTRATSSSQRTRPAVALTTNTVSERHQTPPRAAPGVARALMDPASPSPRAPSLSSSPTSPGVSTELWGVFMAALSPVGGVPLCAIEDGHMTKGTSLVPFALQLIVHGLDDYLPATAASRQLPGATSKCFLQLLGEYIYDLSPSAPSALACYRAACVRELEERKKSSVHSTGDHTRGESVHADHGKTGPARSLSATTTTTEAVTPSALVQVLPTATRAAATTAHRPQRGTTQRLLRRDAQPRSSTSSTSSTSNGTRGRHQRRRRHPRAADGRQSSQIFADTLNISSEAMNRYVAAATTASDTHHFVAQFKHMKRLSQLTATDGAESAPGSATAVPPAEGTRAEAQRWTRSRGSHLRQFVLQPDGSVVRQEGQCIAAGASQPSSSVFPRAVAPSADALTAAALTTSAAASSPAARAVMAALADLERAVEMYCHRVEHDVERQEAIAMGGHDRNAND